MLSRIIASFGIAIVGGSMLPASAQLASSASQFKGSVPKICQIAKAVNTETAMSTQEGGLYGETEPFSYMSNTPVSLQLRQIKVDGQPVGSTGVYEAALKDEIKNQDLVVASAAQASSASKFASPLMDKDQFRLRLRITPQKGEMLTAGEYLTTVTVDCISPNG
jgi:hypothetical protein